MHINFIKPVSTNVHGFVLYKYVDLDHCDCVFNSKRKELWHIKIAKLLQVLSTVVLTTFLVTDVVPVGQ